jgi:hypothetical protein
MIKTALNGNFGLAEIKKIVKRFSGLTPYYLIILVNDKRKIYACDLHAFLTETNIPKCIKELQCGDRIWIDISAFSKDGTLK